MAVAAMTFRCPKCNHPIVVPLAMIVTLREVICCGHTVWRYSPAQAGDTHAEP